MREDLCSSCPAAVVRPSATLLDSLPRPRSAAVSAALPRRPLRLPPFSPAPRCSSSALPPPPPPPRPRPPPAPAGAAAAVLAGAALLVLAAPARGQNFGRNQVSSP